MKGKLAPFHFKKYFLSRNPYLCRLPVRIRWKHKLPQKKHNRIPHQEKSSYQTFCLLAQKPLSYKPCGRTFCFKQLGFIFLEFFGWLGFFNITINLLLVCCTDLQYTLKLTSDQRHCPDDQYQWIKKHQRTQVSPDCNNK